MPSSFFHTRGSLVHDERSTKKDRLGRNNVLIVFLIFPDSLKYSFACRADLFVEGVKLKANAFPLAVFVRHANFVIP